MFLSCFGYFFDFFQAAVNLSDITTDFLVTIEFYNQDRMVFFGLVLTSIIMSSFINAITFALRLENHFPSGRRPSEWYHWLGVVLALLPIAQLLPVINYVVCACYPEFEKELSIKHVDWGLGHKKDKNKNKDKNITLLKKDDSNNIDDSSPNHHLHHHETAQPNNNNNNNNNNTSNDRGEASAEMFSESVSPQHEKLGILDRAVTSRAASFMLFNINCVSESVPNAVIQLIAISLAEEATTLQIISLSLSLFSVACKAFQLCRSFTTVAFWAKYFYISHDLFKMAFVMSAILSTTGPADIALFGSGLHVTYLSFVWIVIKIMVLGVSLLCGIAIFVKVISDGEDCEDRCLRPLALLLGFCLLVGPFIIVQETLFLTFLIIFNATKQPGFEKLPHATLLHEFLWSGSSSKQLREVTDWRSTLQKLQDHTEEYSKKPEEPTTTSTERQQPPSGTAAAAAASGTTPPLPRVRRNMKRGPRATLTSKDAGFCSRLFRRLQQPFISSSISKPDNFFSRARHVHFMGVFFRGCSYVPAAKPNFWTWRQQLVTQFQSLKGLINSSTTGEVAEKLLDPSQVDHLEYKDVLPSYRSKSTKYAHTTCSENCQTFLDAECEVIVGVFMVLACIIGGIMGALYPILHAALYFNSFTIMMSICWYAWAFSLLMSILLSVGFYRYHITSEVFHDHVASIPNEIPAIVDSYFSIPMSVVQVAAVPNQAIPSECFEKHVLQFLDPRNIGLYGIGTKNYEEMHSLFDLITKETEREEQELKEAVERLTVEKKETHHDDDAQAADTFVVNVLQAPPREREDQDTTNDE